MRDLSQDMEKEISRLNIIARAAFAIYDGSLIAPVFPDKANKPEDQAAEYLCAVAEKLMHADASRTTHVEPGSAQEELLRRFGYTPFQEAANALLRSMDESMQMLEIAREGFDMAVFSFEQEGEPHLCVAYLPYRRAFVSQMETDESGAVGTRLLPHAAVLAPPGAKGMAGFVINLSTGEIRLRDSSVNTQAGPRALFAQGLFAMADTRSTKEAVKVVADMMDRAAPDHMARQELTPALKRAMSRSIEEKGVIDVQDVAEEVFRTDPEREAIIEEVARQMQEERIEPVIPVENRRVVAQLSRMRVRTDTGISITLPRELADDESSFAVVDNDDGTISIIIGRVQELKTE